MRLLSSRVLHPYLKLRSDSFERCWLLFYRCPSLNISQRFHYKQNYTAYALLLPFNSLSIKPYQHWNSGFKVFPPSPFSPHHSLTLIGQPPQTYFSYIKQIYQYLYILLIIKIFNSLSYHIPSIKILFSPISMFTIILNFLSPPHKSKIQYRIWYKPTSFKCSHKNNRTVRLYQKWWWQSGLIELWFFIIKYFFLLFGCFLIFSVDLWKYLLCSWTHCKMSFAFMVIEQKINHYKSNPQFRYFKPSLWFS